MCAADAPLVMNSSRKRACDPFYSLWCDPWACTSLVAVLLVARGGVVLQKLRDLHFAPLIHNLQLMHSWCNCPCC